MEEEGECEYFDGELGNHLLMMILFRSVSSKVSQERVSLNEAATKTWEARID